ncbi:MAG: coproporphyrinogen dehydrogenase HemZ, partial [Oscillospiraceae bacterium]
MIIINKGHSFQYEIERIVTMFFDGKETKTYFEDIDTNGENFVKTALKKGDTETILSVEVFYEGETKTDEKRIDNDEAEYNKYCERFFALMIKTILSDFTGIQLKWGGLTGIRPVKLIGGEFSKGKNEKQVHDVFCNELMVSEGKYNLARKTLEQEEKILSLNTPKSFSLYLSMPFCPTRCHYCSFVSSAIGTKKARELVPKYVELLCKELEYTGKMAKELGLKLETIYFGGGTPTTMSAPQLKMVTDTISQYFDVENTIEYTVEAGRPDTIDREK